MQALIGKTSRRHLRKNQSGSAAVEFALVVIPMMGLMFALFEIMMIFFVQTTLESAIAEEARKIKTGQANAGSGINAATFKANVCGRMVDPQCGNRLSVMVETPASAPLVDPFTTPAVLNAPPYQQGTAAGAIIVVRGFYVWPLMTPGLSEAFTNTSITGPNNSKSRLLVATSAFRNEPFQ